MLVIAEWTVATTAAAVVLVRLMQVFSRHPGGHTVKAVLATQRAEDTGTMPYVPVTDRYGKYRNLEVNGAPLFPDATVVMPAIDPDEDWYATLGDEGTSRAVRRLKQLMGSKGWTSVRPKPRTARKPGKRRRKNLIKRAMSRSKSNDVADPA